MHIQMLSTSHVHVVQGSDFHRDMSELHDEHVGLRNYRLDAASLASRQFGEVSCREFRESVMHVMPHR